MRILLLSAYDADSHRYWRQGLQSYLGDYDWTVLTLPARFFSWRVRSNALTWAFDHQDILSQNYDLILATSMTDLSTLKGFSPNLAQIPSVVYFHENQFGYPGSGKEFQSVEPKILNFYTALSADRVLFNSEYNAKTFFTGLDNLLRKVPDCVPSGLVDSIKSKSTVLPVPITQRKIEKHSSGQEILSIVWNHRWEYDKNPKLLLDSMMLLQSETEDFQLHVVGKQFRKIPKEFELLKANLGSRIGKWGYLESESEYYQLLKGSDVVLSTAIHDFQGVAVLEGVAAGAVPVVPNRLAYCELFDECYRYAEEGNEAENLANHLLGVIEQKRSDELSSPDIEHLSWEHLIPEYRKLFESAVENS